MNRSSKILVALLALLSTAQLALPPRFRRPRVRVVDFNAPPRDWSQFNYDVHHSGSNADEDGINPGNVATLQRIFQTKLPAVTDGAPILWSANSKRRTEQRLFLTATNGTLFSLSGDGELLWQTTAPPGPRWTTSSPALDPAREWVYSYALDGRVHKYAIRSGEEFVGGGWPALVTKKPDVEKGSAALSVATTINGTSFLYATVAGYPDPGDAGDYQGHIVAIRLPDARTSTFNVLCSNKPAILGNGDCAWRQAGVWGRAGVVYNEADNSVFVVTSNGPFNADSGGFNWGDSILRLHPDLRTRNGYPVDSYTPAEYPTLDARDLDLGSSGLALLRRPGQSTPTLGVHAGKDMVIRLVDLKNLSGQGGPGHVGGELQRIDLPQRGYHFAAPAVYVDDLERTWVYFANNRGISAFELTGDAKSPKLVERWQSDQAANSSPVVVNGVVFTVRTGRITALDAFTGKELWYDTRVGQIHWQSPIVVNSAVYICDLDGNVTGYALPKEIIFVR